MDINEENRRQKISTSQSKRWMKVSKKKRSSHARMMAIEKSKNMTSKQKIEHASMMASRKYAKQLTSV